MKEQRRIPIKKNIQFLDDYWIRNEYGINSELHTIEYPYKHFHTFYEIIVILKGKMEHFFTFQDENDKMLAYSYEVLTQNTLQIIPPECIHYYCYLDSNTEYFNITISRDVYKNICNLLNFENEQFPMTAKISNEQLDYLAEGLKNIQDNDFSEIKKAALHKILVSDCFGIFINNAIIKQQRPQWLSELLLTLQNPHNFDKTIDQIVGISHYSHSQLCKLFKSYMKISIQEYFTKQKMDYACYLLQHTDMKIITVASLLGYDSHSFFSKIFCKLYGITPLQFRKQKIR